MDYTLKWLRACIGEAEPDPVCRKALDANGAVVSTSFQILLAAAIVLLTMKTPRVSTRRILTYSKNSSHVLDSLFSADVEP